MSKIHWNLLILCAVLSQEVVASSNESGGSSTGSSKSSLTLLSPRKRYFKKGASREQPLPARPQNLREVHIDKPTLVAITLHDLWIASGHAIHPYIVVARVSDLRKGFGIATIDEKEKKLIPQKVKNTTMKDNFDIAMIELEDPIILSNPQPGALEARGYGKEAIDSALTFARNLIRKYMGDPPRT